MPASPLSSSATLIAAACLASALGACPLFAEQSSSTAAQTAAGGQSTQARRTGWVVEVHVGSMPEATPTKVGAPQLPAQGSTFTSGGGGGSPSRQVPSWYFGDGASIANAAAAQLGMVNRLVPLDAVLTGPAVTRRSSVDFGARIGHTITDRVLLLFSYDQAPTTVALTSSAQSALAATNASFKPFWTEFLVAPLLAKTSASSALTITETSGSMKVASVAAEIRILTTHQWTPYVTVGAGVQLPLPTAETAVTLVGHYETVRTPPGGLLSETDQVRLRYEARLSLVPILGAGVERDLSSHVGVRAEFRSFLNGNEVRTRLDAQPVSGPTAPPFTNIRSGTNPDLQISTNQTTTLSLRTVNHFDALTVKGALPIFSAGLFFRF